MTVRLTAKKIESLATSCKIIAQTKGYAYLHKDFCQYVYLIYLENPERKSKLKYMWYDFLMSEKIIYREKQGAKRKPFFFLEYKTKYHDEINSVEQQFKIPRFDHYFTGKLKQFYLDYYVHEIPRDVMLEKYNSMSRIYHLKIKIIMHLKKLIHCGVIRPEDILDGPT